MLGFVRDRGRAASPQNNQNGHPGVSARRQAAANSKVSTKKGALAQEIQFQSAIPSRGIGNVQNSSAVVHHRAQRRPSSQDQHNRQDLYDTDAESIDTTTNPSVVKLEDNQPRDWQHQRIDQSFYRIEESERDNEEIENNEDETESYYEITDEGIKHLRQYKLMDVDDLEQLNFLQQRYPSGLRMVKGDSYPPTTDGHPTELEADPEQPSNDGGDEQSSPSPRRLAMNPHLSRPSAPQPIKQEPLSGQFEAAEGIPGQSNLIKKSANIRAQDRSNAHQARPTAKQALTGPPTSQPPSYSQSSPGVAPNPPVQHHENIYAHINEPLLRFQLPPPRPRNTAMHPHSVHSSVEPSIPPQPPQQTPDDVEIASIIDYDPARLFAMKYDELKNEGFDKDPRAGAQALTKDVLQKPLVERLEYVQKNLDKEKQSSFFTSLPTAEWEDAGDWFLDQFQSIIQRTKEARQRKRKLAHEIEDEIEKRHKHVSKKQCQVQQAMDKMKVQGEGLVPKSPRPSNSPRSKRG